jgi:rhodanese-related sulfurtransferase
MFGFGAKTNNVTAEQLRGKLAGGEVLEVIDVREPWEFEEGHIKGAKLMPLGNIRQWAKVLDKNKDIYLVCRTGARSAAAYQNLKAAGFEKITNVSGGMVAWRGEVIRGK